MRISDWSSDVCSSDLVEISPPVRARSNNFQISKQYLLQGLGFGAMPTKIICSDELGNGSLVPLFPDWQLSGVEVHMLCPIKLSASNLIQAFHDTDIQIINATLDRILPITPRHLPVHTSMHFPAKASCPPRS